MRFTPKVLRLLVLAVISSGSLVVAQAPAGAAIDCSRGTQMDIGLTIFDGKVKGSASYTSCPDRPIVRAEIWIRRNGGRLFATKVEINNIATPSQRSFSPEDKTCNSLSTQTYDTFVVFYHRSGQTELNSNDITVVCG